MLKPFKFSIAVLTGFLTVSSVGCSSNLLNQFSVSQSASPTGTTPSTGAIMPVSQAAQPTTTVSTSVPPQTATPASDSYQQAIERASSAFTLSQSAQSQDDWILVARRWQQAIDLMGAVPKNSTDHVQAQKKVTEYRNNLAYAQQQSRRSTANPVADGTVVIRESAPPPRPTASAPSPQANPTRSAPVTTAARPTVAQPNADGSRTFYAPIIRREGNTPVIRVIFNGNQAFDMIVDTGASGTLITQNMAQALGVAPVAATVVDTASERGVTVPLGYVSSMEVNGALARNVLVAIAGPQLGTGLLGHDFFGGYDVTIRQDEVEFRER